MNYSTKRRTNRTILWIAVSSISLILAGCQSSDDPDPQSFDKALHTDQNVSAEGPQGSYINNNAASNNNLASKQSSIPDHESTTETSNLQTKQGTKPNKEGKKSDGWSLVSPKLNGIAIGDSDSKILDHYGAEIDSYLLENKTETINVLEYDGFAVGINTDGTVQFVEVYGEHITSGVSGLKIGDHTEKVVKELGKPDTQSDFLLLYKATGATLKLDVDPDEDEIVSIKLLAHTHG